MKKLFVFDFDGTLADTRGLIEQAALDYSKENNMPLPDTNAICVGYSNPDNHDFGWGLDKEEQFYHMDKMFISLSDKIANGTYNPELFNYTKEILTDLHNDSHHIALCTAREKDPCISTLKHHGILDYFRSFRTRDDVTERGLKPKPHPDLLLEIIDELGFHKDHVYMVGDTTADMDIAKSSGVKSIAVSWGYHDRKTLETSNPDYFIDDFKELMQIIK